MRENMQPATSAGKHASGVKRGEMHVSGAKRGKMQLVLVAPDWLKQHVFSDLLEQVKCVSSTNYGMGFP